MRRAVIRALRTTSQCPVRGQFLRPLRRSISFLSHHNHLPSTNPRNAIASGSSLRSLSTSASLRAPKPPPPSQYAISEPLQSSMYARRLSVALVSGLVGYGAWYSYQGNPLTQVESASFATTTTNRLAADGAAPTRNVLVVGADELHTGTFVGEGPISKNANGAGGNVLEMLTPEQATEKLREHENSYTVNRGSGVLRYDFVQVASNNPIEDDHAEQIVHLKNKDEAAQTKNDDWMFWGVFDGHAGWTTSATLRENLIGFVARELNTTYQAASTMGSSPSPEAVDAAIKAGFLRLDNEIVNESVQRVFKAGSKRVAAELLGPALSGSCALLSFYDTASKTLRVACTGDSRAVLGRRADSGKWSATALSEDQTGSNPNEEARMRKAHPGEARVVHNGRVLGGLEPTRAFGDASYKWTREITDRLRASFFGRSPSPYLKTPPYVTAEPVVTTTKINPERGDFMVMATDGLWEMLTNEEVVGLVGKWIDSEITGQSQSQFGSIWSRMFGGSKGLPVEVAASEGADGQKTPIRLRQWGISPDEKDRFVVKDKNVATHLIRNALGGKNEEQVCALLTLVSPFSRRYRDDLTVQVVFFGNGQNTGEVFANPEATSLPQGGLKAKL